MQGLEDILATSGFWLCMILLIFRGAIRERIANAPAKSKAELSEIKARMQEMEARLAALTTEVIELRDVQDFDRRLAGKPERIGLAPSKAVTSSVSGAGRLTLPQR